MVIEIDSLSFEELLELQHKIQQRLELLQEQHAKEVRLTFKPGDSIRFSHPTKGVQTGTLIQYNEKTVTVVCENGQRWDISPHLLRKVISAASPKKLGKVIEIPKKNKK